MSFLTVETFPEAVVVRFVSQAFGCDRRLACRGLTFLIFAMVSFLVKFAFLPRCTSSISQPLPTGAPTHHVEIDILLKDPARFPSLGRILFAIPVLPLYFPCFAPTPRKNFPRRGIFKYSLFPSCPLTDTLEHGQAPFERVDWRSQPKREIPSEEKFSAVVTKIQDPETHRVCFSLQKPQTPLVF